MKNFALFLALLLTLALPSNSLMAAKLGQPAAPLQVSEWVKGSPADPTQPGDKIHVVEFWATWCPPCRDSIPHLSEMQQKYKDKVTFIGISDEAADVVKPFVQKMGDKMNYTVALDKNGETSKAYMEAFGVNGIPHAFVVDQTGKLIWHGHPMDNLDGVLDQLIAKKFDPTTLERVQKARETAGKYFQQSAAGQNNEQTKALGNQVLDLGATDAKLLNAFAWTIMTSDQLKDRDLKLALQAAEKAHGLTEGKEGAVVDTYARALFVNGQVDKAIDQQKKAIEMSKEPEQKKKLEATLKEYLAGKPAATPK